MTNLIIGASTMFFREQPVASALQNIADIGYTAAEVWVEQMQWHGDHPAKVKQQADSLGLQLTVHATAYDLNPTSTNRGIALESRRQVEKSLAIAAELGALVVAVHPGRRTSSRDQNEEVWPHLLEWVAELDSSADHYGLSVGLELMEKRPKEIFMLPADAHQLMATTWKQLKLTIDVAHMNTVGEPLSFLEQIPSHWIGHVHLSDNDSHQTHLPLGAGRVPLAQVLTALARIYAGVVNLEGYVPGQGTEVLTANLAYLERLGFA